MSEASGCWWVVMRVFNRINLPPSSWSLRLSACRPSLSSSHSSASHACRLRMEVWLFSWSSTAWWWLGVRLGEDVRGRLRDMFVLVLGWSWVFVASWSTAEPSTPAHQHKKSSTQLIRSYKKLQRANWAGKPGWSITSDQGIGTDVREKCKNYTHKPNSTRYARQAN